MNMINLKRLEQRLAKLEAGRLAPPPELPPLMISVAFEGQEYLTHVLWFGGLHESWDTDNGRELSPEVLASLRKHGCRVSREEVSGEVKWRVER